MPFELYLENSLRNEIGCGREPKLGKGIGAAGVSLGHKCKEDLWSTSWLRVVLVIALPGTFTLCGQSFFFKIILVLRPISQPLQESKRPSQLCSVRNGIGIPI